MITVLVCILVVIIEKTAANGYGNEDAENASKRFRTYLEQSGINNFRSYLEGMLSEWKTYPIHIGITGQSGVGKSTFINTIRGLRADDPHAAPVGVVETTKTIVSYPDKNNTNLIYWDLPGCGTSNFPRDSYLNIVDFKKFDHLIIITADRFTENDLWLVNQAQERQKPFFLVRNKINIALENERQDHPSRSEQEVMETIRNNLISQLSNPFLSVYLISTRLNQYFAWDFPKLIKDLIEKAPKAKQQTMVFFARI
jgi:predicted GTPase